MNLSVVVPVFNNEKGPSELIERLGPVMEAVADEYEVIFVNDGSGDGSWEAAGSLLHTY